MKPQEKKYLVDSFESIQKLLQEKHAKELQKVVSTHYYGEHKGNDVEKFVEYADRVEIHVWKDNNGLLAEVENRKISDKQEGFNWLKKRGFANANIVKMEYTEYAYKNGTVGLYIIDDFLRSVVLYYPPDQHATIEKEFGLENAKVITVPYNKLLDQMGKLQSIKLS